MSPNERLEEIKKVVESSAYEVTKTDAKWLIGELERLWRANERMDHQILQVRQVAFDLEIRPDLFDDLDSMDGLLQNIINRLRQVVGPR